MCDYCQSIPPSPIPRRGFLKTAAWSAVALAAPWPPRAWAQTAAGPAAAWARLITPHPLWRLHGEQDQAIAEFLQRYAHLGMENSVYSVDPADAASMANFPFVYTNTLAAITEPAQHANLREYIRRGGFVLAEGCLDHRLTRSFTESLKTHSGTFADLVPGSEIRELPSSHPIYRAFFPVEAAKLGLVEIRPGDDRWNGVKQALYGVYQENRVVSVISLLHLQCEWLTRPDKIDACLQQLANIYVYAMTR